VNAAGITLMLCAALAATEADAHNDRVWFSRRPDRFFRARAGRDGVWLIRRRRHALLPMSIGAPSLPR